MKVAKDAGKATFLHVLVGPQKQQRAHECHWWVKLESPQEARLPGT